MRISCPVLLWMKKEPEGRERRSRARLRGRMPAAEAAPVILPPLEALQQSVAAALRTQTPAAEPTPAGRPRKRSAARRHP